MSDEQDFGRLVAGHSRALLRAGWLMTGDWSLAEDLVQTSLEATWHHWPTIVRRDAPEVYVRRVMVSTWLRWRRRRWSSEVPEGRVPDVTLVDDKHERTDVRLIVLTALNSLSPRQRAVLILRYFDDLTEAETAAALGCSAGSVKAHATRAMTKLRRSPGVLGLLNEGSRL
jgi:RNA polymerase sigma-70 factor (sigma-E family)